MRRMSTSLSLGATAPSRATAAQARLRRIAGPNVWPICAITVVAAALRFTQIEAVSPNEFYDAAVRSMSMSFHNFLFGAFDPHAILSIDKPPLDLWLQVISVKLFGWGQFSLKLPEALGGTAAVPLLYDAVRRVIGRPAGLAAAAALAVFPESVLTARSDTMDSVMMLLVIAALWLTIRAVQSGEARRNVVLAGVALGLAFNVKLMQSLLPVPALVVFYMLGSGRAVRDKVRDLLLAGAALVGVGLSWAIIVTIAPGRHPWAVGSSDGSIWNAMFVFNGVGKIGQAGPSTKPGGPGLFRLVVSTGWHYDLLFGCVLVSALAIGVGGAFAARRFGGSEPGRRLPRAFAISLAVWIAIALFVFDTMTTVHVRYLEAFSPALAAALGYGAAALSGLHDWRGARGTPSLWLTSVTLLAACAYTFSFDPPSIAWGALSLIISAVGAVLIARAPGSLGNAGRWLTAGLIVACVLVFPVHESFSLVRSKANDSLGLAVAPDSDTAALSRYLVPRTAGLRYELAVDEPLSLAPLIIHDQRAILPLTSSFEGRPLTSVAHLQQAVQAGEVRYALVGRCPLRNPHSAACAPAALWVRQHGLNVSALAGLSGRSKLFLLTPSRAA
jgi:4-amino-4-deoxy-L-arabinose transferase-like glycosyltransferase